MNDDTGIAKTGQTDPKPEKGAKSKMESELAKRWGARARTIRKWRLEGCPFDAGDEAIANWLRSRQKVPPATAQLLRPKTGPRSVAVPKPGRRHIPKAGNDSTGGQIGAAHALRRLEQQEERAHAHYLEVAADPESSREEIDGA